MIEFQSVSLFPMSGAKCLAHYPSFAGHMAEERLSWTNLQIFGFNPAYIFHINLPTKSPHSSSAKIKVAARFKILWPSTMHLDHWTVVQVQVLSIWMDRDAEYVVLHHIHVYYCVLCISLTVSVSWISSTWTPDSCLLSLARLQHFASFFPHFSATFASQPFPPQLFWGGAPLRATRASLRSSVRTRTFNVGNIVHYRWNLMK